VLRIYNRDTMPFSGEKSRDNQSSEEHVHLDLLVKSLLLGNVMNELGENLTNI
jgi:hypothetical protein